MSLVQTCAKCGTVFAGDVCPRCAGPQAATPTIVAELKPGTRIRGFEIAGLLGKGGMGVVYRARQSSLDRVVALKVLAPSQAANIELQGRFEREARALAQLSDPNIVTVHEAGVENGLLFVAMEFVEGKDLRAVMRERAIAVPEALRIAGQICSALHHAHAAGVVHRDIKPENVLIDGRGRVRIVDFGLARLIRPDEDKLRLTQSTTAMGTMHYMAPEQWENPLATDGRADLYAVGVLLYELLTGQLPVGKFDPPSKRAGVDARLDAIVMKALEPDPAKRWQSASELGTALAQVTGTPPAASVSSAPVAQARSRTPMVIAVAVCAIALALVAFLVWRPRNGGAASATAGAPRPASQLLDLVEFAEDEGPKEHGFSDLYRPVPNPLRARAPAELDQLMEVFRFLRLSGVSRAELNAGYLCAWTWGTLIAVDTSVAERLERDFLKWRLETSRWSHREGAFLLLVMTSVDSRAPFVEMVRLCQRRLGLPDAPPDLPLERVTFGEQEVPHLWEATPAKLSREPSEFAAMLEPFRASGRASDVRTAYRRDFSRENQTLRVASLEFAGEAQAEAFERAARELPDTPIVMRSGAFAVVVTGSADVRTYRYVLDLLANRLGVPPPKAPGE